MSAFSEVLLQHYEAPRNVGELPPGALHAEDENPVCGDRLQVWLRVEDGIVQEMRWQAEGCAPAIAAASITSELVRGMSVAQARDLSREHIAEALGGLPARKLHAAMLAAGTVRAALNSMP